jgi:hypothetical protein
MSPRAALCALCLLGILAAGAAQSVAPLAIQEFNQTWAARVEWSGQLPGSWSLTLQPPIPVPKDTVLSLVLGGHSDNDAATLALQCSGPNHLARVYMTPSYGIAIEKVAFPYPGACTVTVTNPSSAPVNAYFLLAMVDIG